MQNTMSESEKAERPTNQTALKNDSSTEVWHCIENIFSLIFHLNVRLLNKNVNRRRVWIKFWFNFNISHCLASQSLLTRTSSIQWVRLIIVLFKQLNLGSTHQSNLLMLNWCLFKMFQSIQKLSCQGRENGDFKHEERPKLTNFLYGEQFREENVNQAQQRSPGQKRPLTECSTDIYGSKFTTTDYYKVSIIFSKAPFIGTRQTKIFLFFPRN